METDKDAAKAICGGLPEPRMQPFIQAAQGDERVALELYSWNAQMAGAALEQLAHLEVLLRHAIDSELARYTRESERKIPWFLVPPFYPAQADAIDKVRERLRAQDKETRDQIVAGFTFGFWSGWFGAKYEELWRHSLHRAFPKGSGDRKEVSKLVEQIRKFRNRVAHHDSLLNVDIGFEMLSVFKLASIINEDVCNWMKQTDRTREIGAVKPVESLDTVVVPTSAGLNLIQDPYAYVCQAGRFFQDVSYMAFYEEREIKKSIHRIKDRYDNVDWNEKESNRLLESENRKTKKLGRVISQGLSRGIQKGTYQVFILSQPGDPEHVELERPLTNPRTGKGSAFVTKQRYTSVHALRHADNVDEL